MHLAFLMALVLALPAAALAGDGRLEINQACALAGCFPGDTPGIPVQTEANQSYVLTSDIAVGAVSSVGILLEAGSSLDLNGFTIAGEVTCPGAPAVCSEQGFNGGGVIARNGSVVRNGTIRGIRSFGIRLEPFVRVENMRIEQNAAGGVAADAPGSIGTVIQDSLILQNGGNGISLAVGAGALGVRVLRNTIHGNTLAGVAGALSLLADNAITSNGGLGAVLNYSGSTAGFAGNQLYGNNGGNANPQLSGGVSIGANVCATNTTCP